MFYQFNLKNKQDLKEFFEILMSEIPEYINEPIRIKDILEQFKCEDVSVYIEKNYIDKQYRDSFYTYFSQKYNDYMRNCVRLAFFEGDVDFRDFENLNANLDEQIIGTIVLRPLKVGNIGTTLLNPYKLKVKGYFRTCKFKVVICGRKININAFPFSSQDSESMTCAETVLYNLIRYFGQKYPEYRELMPSEILKNIERESYERVLPSLGVRDANIAKVLSDAHFYPCVYSYQDDFDAILYTYIESGIPLVLSIPHHVVTCIGHGELKSINNLLQNKCIFR